MTMSFTAMWNELRMVDQAPVVHEIDNAKFTAPLVFFTEDGFQSESRGPRVTNVSGSHRSGQVAHHSVFGL